MSNNSTLFCCPVCGRPFIRNEHSRALVCGARHSFDLAREGYAHLLPAGQMHAKIPGDSKEMVAARRAFLDTGAYEIFSEGINRAICILLPQEQPVLVDAGCGEGYYTVRLTQALRQQEKTPRVAAFDISKFAVKAAAKRDAGIAWAVASSFRIPLPDAVADCVLNVFSPMAENEFARITKPGGYFIFAVPAPRHLFGLKQVLYDDPYENVTHDTTYQGFAFEKRLPLRGTICVQDVQIMQLFAMTPYYWKTSKAGVQNLQACKSLKTEIGFDLLVYRRC